MANFYRRRRYPTNPIPTKAKEENVEGSGVASNGALPMTIEFPGFPVEVTLKTNSTFVALPMSKIVPLETVAPRFALEPKPAIPSPPISAWVNVCENAPAFTVTV